VYVTITGAYKNSPNGPIVGESVLGLSFAPLVRVVEMKASTGRTITRQTKVLNRQQRSKTRLPRFRYVALGLQDDVCIASITRIQQVRRAFVRRGNRGVLRVGSVHEEGTTNRQLDSRG
jgi:hypothetical protein